MKPKYTTPTSRPTVATAFTALTEAIATLPDAHRLGIALHAAMLRSAIARERTSLYRHFAELAGEIENTMEQAQDDLADLLPTLPEEN